MVAAYGGQWLITVGGDRAAAAPLIMLDGFFSFTCSKSRSPPRYDRSRHLPSKSDGSRLPNLTDLGVLLGFLWCDGVLWKFFLEVWWFFLFFLV